MENIEKQVFETAPSVDGKVSLRLKPESIQDAVLFVFGITKEELESSSRKRPAPECRQVISFLMSKYTDLSLANISKYIGNRDRSTVLNSIEVFHNMSTTDRVFAAKVVHVENMLGICD